MSNLVSEVVEFISNEREPITPNDVAMELVRLGANCKLWPMASYDEWRLAIFDAIQAGLIVEQNEKVRLAPEPEKEQSTKPSQLELF